MIRKIMSVAMLIATLSPFCLEGTHAENSSMIIHQDKKQIKGSVFDESGQPLIGVNIGVKGTTSGTITDMDGKFNLDVSPNATLVISYIGYKTIEIKASDNLEITLKEDAEALDEVVVIGYGVARKSDLTGSVGGCVF